MQVKAQHLNAPMVSSVFTHLANPTQAAASLTDGPAVQEPKTQLSTAQTRDVSARAAMGPKEWHNTFSGPPDYCSAAGDDAWTGALVRRWCGTAPAMEQPPLDRHYLVLHLGGAKRVTRRGLNSLTIREAPLGSVTLVPVGSSYSWMTEGPIGFAHVYLDPRKMDHVVTEEFDRDSRQVELLDRVADHLPLLSALMSGLLDELETPTVASRLLLDTLFHAITVRVLSECSTLSTVSSSAQHTISPRRLRRVLDYIDSHLSTDIGLQDLAAVAGSSRFHFSRAFRDATGTPPYRYLIQRRVDAAKSLLLQDALSISQVAENCGFNSRSQFATMFKRVNGTSPARYRREH